MAGDGFYDFGGDEPSATTGGPVATAATTVLGLTLRPGDVATRGHGVEAVIAECDLLTRSIDGILAVIVATSDGMLIHSTWDEVEGMRAAAISAAALGLGERIAADFGQGEFHDSVVSTGDRVIGIYSVGDGFVLGVVAAAEDVSLGLLHLNARQTARSIEAILERTP
jgi:predicted regulator of Ras-like GTPase activity (Roadblock/LC7/MglB family)